MVNKYRTEMSDALCSGPILPTNAELMEGCSANEASYTGVAACLAAANRQVLDVMEACKQVQLNGDVIAAARKLLKGGKLTHIYKVTCCDYDTAKGRKKDSLLKLQSAKALIVSDDIGCLHLPDQLSISEVVSGAFEGELPSGATKDLLTHIASLATRMRTRVEVFDRVGYVVAPGTNRSILALEIKSMHRTTVYLKLRQLSYSDLVIVGTMPKESVMPLTARTSGLFEVSESVKLANELLAPKLIRIARQLWGCGDRGVKEIGHTLLGGKGY